MDSSSCVLTVTWRVFKFREFGYSGCSACTPRADPVSGLACDKEGAVVLDFLYNGIPSMINPRPCLGRHVVAPRARFPPR